MLQTCYDVQMQRRGVWKRTAIDNIRSAVTATHFGKRAMPSSVVVIVTSSTHVHNHRQLAPDAHVQA